MKNYCILILLILLSFEVVANYPIEATQICSTSPTGMHILYNLEKGTDNYCIINLNEKKRVYEFKISNSHIFQWLSDSAFVYSIPHDSNTIVKQVNFYEGEEAEICSLPTNLLDSILEHYVFVPRITNEEKLGLFYTKDWDELFYFDMRSQLVRSVFSFKEIGTPINLALSPNGNYLSFTIIEEDLGNIYLLNLNNLNLDRINSSEGITSDSFMYFLKNEDLLAYYFYEVIEDLPYAQIKFYNTIHKKELYTLSLKENEYPSLMFDFPIENSVLLYYFTNSVTELNKAKGDKVNVDSIFKFFLKSINKAYSNMDYMIVNYEDSLSPSHSAESE